ncbi:hypothetical protein [Streptomyces sp. HPF1205]|uniref:hypothetical protein n=1 Tax=Streptomyces sp. HPF1205 TaxID=2873262 RepID=UPI001CED9FAD|nr:hypothetical protein [Streptomyces sp. HPF1205]
MAAEIFTNKAQEVRSRGSMEGMHSDLDALAGCDPVVWEFTARQPLLGSWEIAAESPELEELVTSLGCELLYQSDEIDSDASYEWRVLLPRSEHERRGPASHPPVIEQIWQYLRCAVPSEQPWLVAPHVGDTLRLSAGQALRAAYTDLLDPLERVLAPLRMDSAAPRVTYWGSEEGLQAGTWDLRMGPDFESAADWIEINAGVAVDGSLLYLLRDHLGCEFNNQLWTWADQVDWGAPPLEPRTGLDPRHPVLILPRPTQLTWCVTLARPSFSYRTELYDRVRAASESLMIDSCYRWTDQDSQRLADRLAEDVPKLLPYLRPSGFYGD